MKITPNCVVALTWKLQDTLGETLDELDEPVEFLLGGQDLLASIEQGLQGHEAGDSLDLYLEPEHAFGEYDEQRVFLESRSLFPTSIEEGMSFEGVALPLGTSSAIPREQIYTVTEVYPEHVVLDGNHPLAGIALKLKLKVMEVREAQPSETARGSLGTSFFKLEGCYCSDSSKTPETRAR